MVYLTHLDIHGRRNSQDVARFTVGPVKTPARELAQPIDVSLLQSPALLVAVLLDLGRHALLEDVSGVDRYQPLLVLAHEADESGRSRVLLASNLASLDCGLSTCFLKAKQNVPMAVIS